MKNIRQTIFLFCLLLLASSVTFAQLSGGSLTGTITDSNGSVVAKAKVTAIHVASGRAFETTTTSEGLYVLPNLEVGPYKITVEATGFKKLTLEGVVIYLGNRTVSDAKLETGNLSDTVTVTTDAPQLQSTTTEVGVIFAPKLLVDAPISGAGIRNPEAFIGFQPGVTNGAGAEGGISGGQRRSKEILIDGANATNPASGGVAFNGLSAVESIGEFKPNNHIFAAEYRRTDGDSEPFVTQSGGSQFHGSAYDFHTNSALDAATGTGKADSTAANPVFRKTPFHSNN